MSGLRRLVREVARSESYKGTGTTDAFIQIFEDIWRRSMKHPENERADFRACKKVMRHGKRKGLRPIFKSSKRRFGRW